MCDLEYFSHDLHSMEKCLAGVRLSNLGFTSSHYQKYVSSVFTHRHSFKRIPNPITKRISQTSLRHQDPAMPGGQQIRPSRTTIIYLSARQPWITIKCRWRQECKVTCRIVRRSWPTSGKNSLDMQGQCHLFLAVWETLEHTLKLELKTFSVARWILLPLGNVRDSTQTGTQTFHSDDVTLQRSVQLFWLDARVLDFARP